MKWKIINNKRVYTSEEGYLLEVVPRHDNYIWAIYKNGNLINSSIIEKISCKDYRIAKKMALQRMIKHYLKTENQ